MHNAHLGCFRALLCHLPLPRDAFNVCCEGLGQQAAIADDALSHLQTRDNAEPLSVAQLHRHVTPVMASIVKSACADKQTWEWAHTAG